MKRDLSNLIGCLFIGSILFTSCTEIVFDSVSEKEPDAPFGSIYFDMEKSQTRGGQLTTGTLTQIGVFASRNKGNYNPEQSTNAFMYNQLVEKIENVWRYSPIKYWPGDDESISFFAYGPYLNNPNVLAFSPKTQPGLPRFTYNVPQNVADQIDFLVAEPKYDRYYSTTPTVDFRFAHMLSCIDFSARVADDFPSNITMKVTQVVISGLKTQGQLPIRIDGKINWELMPEKTYPFSLSVNKGELKDLLLNKNSQLLSLDTNKFMPIPQTIGEEVTLAVRAQYASAAGTDEVVFENKLNNWLSQLLPGKRYVISLTLNITGIIVDFEIVPWDQYEMDIPSFD